MKPREINPKRNEKVECVLCSIRHLVLFADLEQDDFQCFQHSIKKLEFKPGDILYEQQDTIDYVYTIRSGLVKLVHYLPNGSYRITRLLRQGDLAGIETITGSSYIQRAIAMQDTSVCRIPVKKLQQLNHESCHLYTQLTARWQKIQNDADIWLTDLTMGSSRRRVANLLIYLANSDSEASFFLPSREDIGALLAITTETASRIIAELKRSGFLKTHKNLATIDGSKLKLIQ